MMVPPNQEGVDLSEIHFVRLVTVGAMDRPVTNEDLEVQIALLNRCLTELPKGRIIGKSVSTFMFNYQDLPGRYEQTVYHIGWKRKPPWITAEERAPLT